MALRGPWGPADLVKIGPTAKDLSKVSSTTTSTSRGAPSRRAATTYAGSGGSSRARRRPSTRTLRPMPSDRGSSRSSTGSSTSSTTGTTCTRATGRWSSSSSTPRRRPRRWSRRRSRSDTASTKARSGPPGTTTSSSGSTGRTLSCTRPRDRTRTSTARRSTSAARPIRASAATTRARRIRHPSRRSDDPERPGQARADFPWIAFEGRWGELQPAFFNGPTGPNLKTQWTEPIRWSEGWRDRSYTVPGGSAFGTGATDFFCGVIEQRLEGARPAHPPAVAFGLVLAGLALLVVILISRATWRPTAPLRLAHRRAWGQILSARRGCTGGGSALFVGIGLVVIPISLLISLLQALVLHATSILGVQTGGENSGLLALLVLAIGTALTLLGLGLVQAATAQALVRIDEGRPVGPSAPIAWPPTAPRRSWSAPDRGFRRRLAARELDLPDPDRGVAGRPVGPDRARDRARGPVGLGALRRSGRLVRRRWLKVASLIVAGGALVVVAGPLIGALLILAHQRALLARQRDRRVRLCGGDAVRRAHDRLRVLRRPDPPRARGREREQRTACGDRALAGGGIDVADAPSRSSRR